MNHKGAVLAIMPVSISQEDFEGTKQVIRIRRLKKDRQLNGQKKKNGKRTNHDLQYTTQKTKDQATRIQLKTGVNSGSPEGSAVPAQLVTLVMLL